MTVSMQNWVCTNCAPAATFALRLAGSQPGGGSIGMSAAPMKNGAAPPTLVPWGSFPSRMACAVSVRVRELRSNTGLRSEEHTSELQSHSDLVCRLLLEKK